MIDLAAAVSRQAFGTVDVVNSLFATALHSALQFAASEQREVESLHHGYAQEG